MNSTAKIIRLVKGEGRERGGRGRERGGRGEGEGRERGGRGKREKRGERGKKVREVRERRVIPVLGFCSAERQHIQISFARHLVNIMEI